jgi:hypothetical protein
MSLALHYREFHRASRERRGFYFFILSVEWSERINHTPFGQGVYFVIASRILYRDYLVQPV